MFASIRRYNVQAGAIDLLVKKVNDEFLPQVSQSPGFQAYYLITPGDDTVVSVSVFDDRAGAEASTRMATEWVKREVHRYIKTAPVIITGEVGSHAVPAVR